MKHSILRTGVVAAAVAVAGCGLFGGQPASAKTITATPETINDVITTVTADDTVVLTASDTSAYYDNLYVDGSMAITADDDVAVGQIHVRASDVTIEGINFKKDGGAAGILGAVEVGDVDNLTIVDNHFDGYNQPIHIEAGHATLDNLQILNNTFVNTMQMAIYLETEGSNVLVQDNTFDTIAQIRGVSSNNRAGDVQYINNTWNLSIRDGADYNGNAIMAMDINGLTISGNIMKVVADDNSSDGGAAIAIQGSVDDIAITDNIISGSGNGIGMSSSQWDSAHGHNHHVVIEGNTIADIANAAINVAGSTHQVEISDNELSNSKYGIRVTADAYGRKSDITINGDNTVSNMSEYGVYAVADAIPDDDKIVIADGITFADNAEDIYDIEDGAQIDDQRAPVAEEPGKDDVVDGNDDTTTDATDTETPAVTEPVVDDATVKAPNTGLTRSAADSIHSVEATIGTTSTLATVTTAAMMLIVLAGIRIATKE